MEDERGAMYSKVRVASPFTQADREVDSGNEAASIEARDAFARWPAEHQPGAMTGVLLRDTKTPYGSYRAAP